MLSTYYVLDTLLNPLHILTHLSPQQSRFTLLHGKVGGGQWNWGGERCTVLSDALEIPGETTGQQDSRLEGRRESQRRPGSGRWVNASASLSLPRTDAWSDCPAGFSPTQSQKCPQYISSFFHTLKHITLTAMPQ